MFKYILPIIFIIACLLFFRCLIADAESKEYKFNDVEYFLFISGCSVSWMGIIISFLIMLILIHK